MMLIIIIISAKHFIPILAGKSCERSRMQQLVQWCGGANFEGCLVFDECHKAKNFVPVSGKRFDK